MKEDVLNMSVRKFLKKLGVTAQRQIEESVREAIREGKLRGDERIPVRARVEMPETGLDCTVEGAIELE